jgi:hypothetical protein
MAMHFPIIFVIVTHRGDTRVVYIILALTNHACLVQATHQLLIPPRGTLSNYSLNSPGSHSAQAVWVCFS